MEPKEPDSVQPDSMPTEPDIEYLKRSVKMNFSSFTQAAKEAAISRFWGGIHFTDAIDNGIIQGNKVGKRVIAKLNGQKGA